MVPAVTGGLLLPQSGPETSRSTVSRIWRHVIPGSQSRRSKIHQDISAAGMLIRGIVATMLRSIPIKLSFKTLEYEGFMKTHRHLCDFLDQRRAALLDELDLVDKALAKADRTPELVEWLKKLETWRDELRAVVDAMPHVLG